MNSGDFAGFVDVVAQDSVDHDPAPGQVPGPQGYADMFGELRFSGTHSGEFQGHAPTGRHFSVRGMQISRFVDGRMVERWGSSDQLGILTQLGLA